MFDSFLGPRKFLSPEKSWGQTHVFSSASGREIMPCCTKCRNKMLPNSAGWGTSTKLIGRWRNHGTRSLSSVQNRVLDTSVHQTKKRTVKFWPVVLILQPDPQPPQRRGQQAYMQHAHTHACTHARMPNNMTAHPHRHIETIRCAPS